MPIDPKSRDRWGTAAILLEGGIITNEDLLYQGKNHPGSLITGTNYETSLTGGYRRISGYSRYIADTVPGTGQILGTFVFNNGVMAMRGASVSFAATSATTWTLLTSTATTARTGALKYRAITYNWVAPTIAAVDGDNTPFKYTSSGWTDLSAAPASAGHIAEFKRHLFLAVDNSQTLTFSAPGDDTNYAATAGAGAINVGFGVHGLGTWRDELYVFGKKNISKVTGTSASNWVLSPVTQNIGCVAPDSIREVGGDLVFLSADGVRTIAGTMRIGDVDISNLSRPVQKKATALIPIENYSDGSCASVVLRIKSQYRIFASRAGTDRSTQGGLIGCLRQNTDGGVNWEWFDFLGANIYSADSAYLNDESELIVHSHNDASDGYVYKQEQSAFNFLTASGNTVNIAATLRVPPLTFDDPQLRKTFYRLCAYIYAESATVVYTGSIYDLNDPNTTQPIDRILANIAVISTYDASDTLYDVALFDPQSERDVKFCTQLEGSAMNASFILYSTGGYPYIVKSLTIEYALNGRR